MKKIIMVLSTVILLSIANKYAIQTVQAASVTNTQQSESNQKGAFNQTNGVMTKEVTRLEGDLSRLQEQLTQVNQGIILNKDKIASIELNITTTTSQVNELQNEINSLEEKITKRTEQVKERVRSIHQSGGNESYIDVLLNSTSFSDFVDRVTAVSTIVEADQELLQQQASEKKAIEIKKVSLEEKLKELSQLKENFKVVQTQLIAQQKSYQQVEIQLKQKREEHIALVKVKATPITTQYINTVITVGNKYIGNSVYAFGGGRSAADIARGRFDCSGFVHWAFAEAGIEIGSSTDSIKHSGERVSASEMRPGDIVFFDTYKKDGHVGIYLGNGKFIGSQSSTGVAIADMTTGYWKDKFKGHVIRV